MIFLFCYVIFQPDVRASLRIAAGAAPGLALLGWYSMARLTGLGLAHHPQSWGTIIKSKLSAAGSLALFQVFDPFFRRDPRVLLNAVGAANLFVVVLISALFLAWAVPLLRRWRGGDDISCREKSMLVACAVYGLVLLVVPFEYVTGVYDFNERFAYPAFMLGFAGLAPGLLPPNSRFRVRLLGGAAALLAVLVAGWTYSSIGRVADRLADTYSSLSRYHLRNVLLLDEEQIRNEFGFTAAGSKPLFLTYRNPLGHFRDCLDLGTVGGILPTGLLRYRPAPDSSLPPAQAVLSDRPPNWVLVFARTEVTDFITRRLARRYVTVERNDGFGLLRRAGLGEPTP